jgi:[protein-PII] uridylyltransferase
MPTLLEKIEADATRRLVLPPNRKPDQELARYKTFLKVESHRLKMLHRAGGDGMEICRARAAVLDALHRHILQAVKQNVVLPPGTQPLRLALVAIGGYGRGELNPFSDIDIMILHDGDVVGTARGNLHPLLAALMNPGGLLYTLYDVGLKVGHSVRTIEDCVRVANSDMQSKTSLIEARLITGDEGLFQRMQNVVLAKCVMGYEEAYIAARLEDQETRRKKYGDSACMQEPNIKNGCGGLRDYQNLVWMTFIKYRTRSLSELHQREMISESEVRELAAAYNFQLRVRNELHYLLNRAVDVISKSVQPTIATHLGYTDRSPSRRLEKFMRDFYVHARNIDLITRTVEQRLALVPQQRRLPSIRDFLRNRRLKAAEQVIDGFRIVNGEILPASPRTFRDQPRRMMRVFLHVQQRGLKLHPDLTQLIRNQLFLVNNEFVRDTHVHGTFLEILNQRGNVAAVLRQMHEVDFLGKYMPEFGKLTCLVQHEFYHQYAADEHTLMCLQRLDEIWLATATPMSPYKEVFQKIERPHLLYLALLLHDAGKAKASKDHSEVSSQLAGRVAKRLNLDGATTHSLRLIIENHLTMVQISQRRDLDDPAVARNFASLIQSTENLNMLMLHTYADSLGTSNKIWNGFKDTLLWTLYRRAYDVLIGGTDFIRAEEKQRELLALEVRRMMPPSFSEDELAAHFKHLPPRYFQIHAARDVLTDLTQAHRFIYYQLSEEDKALEPVIAWHNEPDRGYTSVKICTWDRTGLFSKIAGAFTAAGLNIMGAQIFSRGDGIILDTFYVTDTKSGAMVNREERDKFENYLLKALTGHLDFGPLIARQKIAGPLYQAVGGERIPTVIHFDNENSETRTVIDIETEDRVGLLYTISQALSELGLDISVAKISTEKGAAADSFYVGEIDGSKITLPERQRGIESKLRIAIAGLDQGVKPA